MLVTDVLHPVQRHMVLLELMEMPPPGEISLPVTPFAGALLGESGALLIVEVGISQETSGAACTPAPEKTPSTHAPRTSLRPSRCGGRGIEYLDTRERRMLHPKGASIF